VRGNAICRCIWLTQMRPDAAPPCPCCGLPLPSPRTLAEARERSLVSLATTRSLVCWLPSSSCFPNFWLRATYAIPPLPLRLTRVYGELPTHGAGYALVTVQYTHAARMPPAFRHPLVVLLSLVLGTAHGAPSCLPVSSLASLLLGTRALRSAPALQGHAA
jgi:hypothetical protein